MPIYNNTPVGGGGSGDVAGPSSATNNAIARFDSTSGKLIQNSGITIADGASGALAGSNSGDVTIGIANGLSLVNQALSLDTASAESTGSLTAIDWSTFNGKQDAGNYITELTGDVTATGPDSTAATLATVNEDVGSFGSPTAAPVITVNGKGLVTAVSTSTVTPSIDSVTDLGTGIATALKINTGSAGAPILSGGDAGTPSAIVLTNATGVKAELIVACSDETTLLTTGIAKVTFRMPYAMTLTSVRLQVNTAPTGSVIIVDVKENGTTIFSTKPQIAISAFTSVGGAVPGVISDASLADDAEITINIDQIGSTIAGKGLKVTFIGTRAS